MRICRYQFEGEVGYGVIEDNLVIPIKGSVFGDFEFLDKSYRLEDVKLLAPTIPTKIVGVGLNYTKHAEELKMPIPQNPIIFLKPTTAIVGPEGKIIYPKGVGRVDYEAELGVVIGKPAKNVPPSEASDYILGYTAFNDITARDLQRSDGQWTRAKSFDTFAPIGPWIETELDPSDIEVKAYVNGELKQSGRTSDFIFKVDELVSFISGIMTLLPGDVIATGTPPGVGPIKPGDTITIEIEGIGKLTNYVV